MRELEFTSTFSNEEIEHNFKDFDFFSCIMTALEEVFINEKETSHIINTPPYLSTTECFNIDQ